MPNSLHHCSVCGANYATGLNSLGPYSATIYISGANIIAETREGVPILSATNNAAGFKSVFDAATAYAYAAGGGDVYLTQYQYLHPGGSTIPRKVRIICEENTIIGITGNIDGFTFQKDSEWHGGKIYAPSLTTKAAFVIAGWDAFGMYDFCNIRGVRFSADETGTGTAIFFNGQSGGKVVGVNVADCQIQGFTHGIRMLATSAGWCNGNTIHNVSTIYTANAVSLENDSNSECSLNIIDIQNQYIEGRSLETVALGSRARGNKITARNWDWRGNRPIRIASGAFGNEILSMGGLTVRDYSTGANRVTLSNPLGDAYHSQEFSGLGTGNASEQTLLSTGLINPAILTVTPIGSGTVSGVRSDITHGYHRGGEGALTNISSKGAGAKFQISIDGDLYREVSITATGLNTGNLIAAALQVGIRALGTKYDAATVTFSSGTAYYEVTAQSYGTPSYVRFKNGSSNDMAADLKLGSGADMLAGNGEYGTDNGGVDHDGVGKLYATVSAGLYRWHAVSSGCDASVP